MRSLESRDVVKLKRPRPTGGYTDRRFPDVQPVLASITLPHLFSILDIGRGHIGAGLFAFPAALAKVLMMQNKTRIFVFGQRPFRANRHARRAVAVTAGKRYAVHIGGWIFSALISGNVTDELADIQVKIIFAGDLASVTILTASRLAE